MHHGKSRGERKSQNLCDRKHVQNTEILRNQRGKFGKAGANETFGRNRGAGHILRNSMDCTCQAFDEKRGSCKRQRREAAIAEGKKPLTTRGSGERRKLPQWGVGRSPRKRRDFEHFVPKWSTFLALVNLIYIS